MTGNVNINGMVHRKLGDVEIRELDIFLVCLLFFDPTGGNTNAIYSLVRYTLIVYLGLKNIKCVRDVPFPAGLLCLFSLLMGYSTWINTHNLTWTFSGAMFGFGIVAVLLTFLDGCKRYGSDFVLKRAIVIFGVLLFFNDVLMFVLPYNRADSSTVYLVGNKFCVSYAHCLLSGMMLVCYKDKVAINRIVVLLGALMSYSAGSSTGMMMMVVMLAVTFFPSKTRALLANPLFLAASVAVLNVLIWGSTNLFKLPEFQNFMVNVLHKSPDMTGRDRLYAATFDFVTMKPVFGWGYLTNIYRDTFGYGNAQNGLFHLVTQCGILGTAVYFAGLLSALAGKVSLGKRYFGLYAFLFSMVLGSSVEINLSFQFAFAIALLCGVMRADKIAES